MNFSIIFHVFFLRIVCRWRRQRKMRKSYSKPRKNWHPFGWTWHCVCHDKSTWKSPGIVVESFSSIGVLPERGSSQVQGRIDSSQANLPMVNQPQKSIHAQRYWRGQFLIFYRFSFGWFFYEIFVIFVIFFFEIFWNFSAFRNFFLCFS